MSLVEAQALGSLAALLTSTPWEREDLLAASRLSPHVDVGRWNREVVEADLALNQTYWHVLALIDPYKLPKAARDFGHFYEALKPRLAAEFSIVEDDASVPAREIARFLAIEVRRQQGGSRRTSIPTPLRQTLVDAAGGQPRCWYCGVLFPAGLVEEFCGGPSNSVELPVSTTLENWTVSTVKSGHSTIGE